MDIPTPTEAESHRPPLPLTGGCPCGAIRYEIHAYPLLVHACHYTDCQSRSGSAFALNMPVATAAFRIVQGSPQAWRRQTPSGADTISWFCGDCGGRIDNERPARPERPGRPQSTTVRAGSLDDTSWLSPAAHFFTRSAQPWVLLPEDAACFATAPADFGSLIAAWKARWNEP